MTIVDRREAAREAAVARRAFSSALAERLDNSRTGFARTHHDVRSDADLAAAVGVRLQTVRSWLNPNGRLLPTNIYKILEVLFGDVPKFAAGARRLKALWTEADAQAKKARAVRAIDQGYTTVAPAPPALQPPTAPSIGPGAQFSPTAAGYEIEAAGMSDAERTNDTQMRLYDRVQRQIGKISPLLPTIGNSHPFLASEIADYIALAAVGMNDLDVPTVWSVGSAVREMLAQLTNTSGTMTPELEPEALAMLNSLMRDDIALIQGFSAGRALTQRVRDFQQSAKPVEPTRQASRGVLQALRDIPHLLAAKASRLVASLLRVPEPVQTASLQAIVAAHETAYNCVVAVSRHLQSFDFDRLIRMNEIGKLALTFVNVEHRDLLEASVTLFRDYGPALLALGIVDGQILHWLNWWVSSLKSGHGAETPEVEDWEDIDED
jgi:hypothetical protein